MAVRKMSSCGESAFLLISNDMNKARKDNNENNDDKNNNNNNNTCIGITLFTCTG